MFLKELNQYRYFFMDSIQSTDDNVLTIYLKIGKEGEPEDFSFNGGTVRDTIPILADNNLRVKVVFPSYVAYNVRWETYTVWSDYDIFEGRAVREYSKSRYLEYIRNDTIASDEWPGKLRHFGICCGWELIDVISVDEPKVLYLLD